MCLRAKQVMAVTTGRHFTPMPASGSRPEPIDRVLSVRIAAASAKSGSGPNGKLWVRMRPEGRSTNVRFRAEPTQAPVPL